MTFKFTASSFASAAIMGTLFLAAPMAQAIDRFPEQLGTIGGSLFVADWSQGVTVTLGLDDDLLHPKHNFYWRDGAEGAWQLLYVDNKFQSTKGKTISFNLTPTSSTGEIFFAIDLKHLGQNYLFSTGNGSLNGGYAALGSTHAAVIYDYQATNRVWVGFEDSPVFFLADWDDFTFYATNLKSTPSAIPEPETYAMLLAGLGIIGFVAKRRSPSKA